MQWIGQVAREVISALSVSRNHKITVLSRKPSTTISDPEITWRIVDYANRNNLIEALQGVHTVLSFIQTLSEPDQSSQKNLIDAAIIAGVKRFAPSEYGSKEVDNMSWWRAKKEVRDYLRHVNIDTKILEYTLFQPGLFLDYLAYPHKTTTYVDPLQTIFDFQNGRAIIVQGHTDTVITLTAVADLVAIIVQAVEYEGRWPITGGIRGNRLTFAQILDIGEQARGFPFAVEQLSIEDLRAGNLHSSWGLTAVHRAASGDQAAALLKAVAVGTLLSSLKGAWDSSDEWNQICSDYKITSAKDFLVKIWSNPA